jgi:hypothetical protein
VGSLPLTDSLTLVTKLGLHYPEASGPGNNLSVSELGGAGVLYGLGVSLQLADNVELRARSEHLARPPGSPQSATGDTFLFGANVPTSRWQSGAFSVCRAASKSRVPWRQGLRAFPSSFLRTA